MNLSRPCVVRLTEETILVKVFISMDPTPRGTLEHRKAKFDLLRMIADQIEISQCQGVDFEKMVVYFDNGKWVAECSAHVQSKLK